MHSVFFTVYFLDDLVKIIDHQLVILENTMRAYESQFTKGNVSLKEFIRLKADYFQLKDSETSLLLQMKSSRSQLQILLCSSPIKPSPLPAEISVYYLKTSDLKVLKEKAIANRPDLQIAESSVNQQKLQLSLQKRMAFPDINLQYTYDKNGAYVDRASLFNFGIELPVFNRNTGNIHTAKALTKSFEADYQLKKNQVLQDVELAYNKVLLVSEQNQKVDSDFRVQFDKVNEGLMSNYLKGNLSLLEFTDLFDSYNQSMILISQIRINLINANEELIYSVGN